MKSKFFAFLSRMKYITRWSLMRNVNSENIQEHSHQVAVIAHALAVINNKYGDGKANPERAATLALYHDASEIITSDLPTPIKYYNDAIREAFKQIEQQALNNLLGMIPEDLKPYYKNLLIPSKEDAYEWRMVKAADKISAYAKCLEELKSGNKEFLKAASSLREAILNTQLPEVDIFMSYFIEAFEFTLDEM